LAIHKYKSLLGASGGVARIRNALSLKIFHPDLVAEIAGHVFGVHPKTRVFEILVYFEQRRGNNSVAYQDSRLKISWQITDQEIAVYNDMLCRLRDMLSPLADDLVIKTPISQEWLWSGAHHSGTISLGDEPTTILDSDLNIKNCDNAYVCDGSVVQEHSYANTGLTIGQLALRLASHIRTPGR
jgi:choline dehydrogenase-like flavoprotein